MSDVSLKDHFDEKLAGLKEQNSREHAQMVERLEAIEGVLKRVVTWPALATAILVSCAIYGVLQGVT